MLSPLLVAFIYGENPMPIVYSIILSVIIGGILFLISYKKENIEISIKDGFLIVSLGWFSAGIIGSFPYLFYEAFGPLTVKSIMNGIFESISGFTTTGASVVNNIEGLPKALLFWRSLTHWLGGMGIILLSVAILPLLGVGGMQLFKAEVPGPVAEKLKPRISETALLLWNVYVLISVFEVFFLMLGGMNLFEAICHTFGTMATGGFSTKNASIAAYKSSYIHWVITIFMIISGANFALHYSALKGRLSTFFKDTEFKVYFYFLLVLIVIGSFIHYFTVKDATLSISFRDTAFQIASIVTTTGYVTANYELWPYVLQVIIFLLMFVGGCAGSTGGSIKFMRYIVMFKHTYREVIKQIHPKAIISIKFNDKPISDNVTKAVWSFFFCFILFFVISTIAMSAMGLDLVTASSATIACLGNVGPGFGGVGPISNYSEVPLLGQAILSFLMITGRLEVFTVLLLFVPRFWKH
jgi:trk system potassium uptake protein TrkH